MSLVIEAAGSPQDLGRAHGETARAEIAIALEKWSEASLADLPHASASDYARALISGTGLIESIRHYSPDLLAEITGIAEGAAQPFELVAAYNLMDEQWWFDLGSGLNAPATEPGCSLIGVEKERETLLAQNMDLPKFMDGSQVILHLRPEGGPEQVILSSAGLIGLCGASGAGLAICVNTLLMLNPNPKGLPVAAQFRHALAQPSRAAATETLSALPHASGQHYAVAGRDGITSLEASSAGVAPFPLAGGVLRHTNHPLSSCDEHAARRALLERSGRIAHSALRLSHLEGLEAESADFGQIQAWLDNLEAPICVTPGFGRLGFTFGSMVAAVPVALGSPTEVALRPAFPSEAAWQHFSLSVSS